MKKSVGFVCLVLLFILIEILLINLVNAQAVSKSIQELKDTNGKSYGVNIITSPAEYSTTGSRVIDVKEVTRGEKGLNITYLFDNSQFIGEGVTVDIWLGSVNGSEVKRISDSFSIKRDSPVKRNVFMEISSNTIGIYSLYFQLNSDPSNVVKQPITLEKINQNVSRSIISGKTIFDDPNNKMVSYGVFIILVVIVIFFIVRKHDKNIDDSNSGDSLKKSMVSGKKVAPSK